VTAALKLDLEVCRPAPVTIEEKERVLQTLPAEGAVSNFGKAEARKLTAIEPVLRVHRRIGVYDVKVISVPQAWTGLYERAVLLISLPALRLATSDELAALVAHEIGHEYISEQYADAKIHKDRRRLRELELVCDAIAMRTLAYLAIPPERLQTAVEKTSWYNRERLGLAFDEGNYPSLKERQLLMKQMSVLGK